MRPYYEEKGIVIYHGDCREILPSLPKVDLVLTDPPYGIDYDPQSHKYEHTTASHSKIEGDEAGFDPAPLLSAGAAHILWGANCYADKLPARPSWLTWDKVLQNGFKLRIAECEMAWTDCVGRSQVFRHLWSGAYRQSESDQFLHPTQKPVALMSWCMTRSGVPDGVVLDPFMGSGTTLRAAKDLGRKAIGIEIEEKYCEIAAKRLSQEVLNFENVA